MNTKYCITGFLCCCFLSGTALADNLVKNAGFDDGKADWRGRGRIISEKENSYMELKAKRKKQDDDDTSNGIHQRLETKGRKGLHITFMVKYSEDYKGDGVIAYAGHHRLSGQYFTVGSKEDEKGKWYKCICTIEDLDRKDPDIYIVPLNGRGKLYIDDVVVKEILKKDKKKKDE